MSDEPKSDMELPEDVDPRLLYLVGLADRGIGFGITLFVGGLVITGHLTSTAAYIRAQGVEAEQIIRRNIRSEFGIEFGREWRKRDETTASQLEAMTQASFELPKQPYIHLTNVRISSGNGVFIDGSEPMQWRGKLTSVDGFILKEMAPVASSKPS